MSAARAFKSASARRRWAAAADAMTVSNRVLSAWASSIFAASAAAEGVPMGSTSSDRPERSSSAVTFGS